MRNDQIMPQQSRSAVMHAMIRRAALHALIAVGIPLILFLSTDFAAAQNHPKVDLALVLALDVSGSVDRAEFALQRDGLAIALQHRRVIEAIARGPEGQIAVAVVQWGGLDEQSVSVPWTIISDHASAARFAQQLVRAPRRYMDGGTHISGLIRFATRFAIGAPVSAARRVIDISGDGIDNVQYSTHGARDGATRVGLTINGLAILNEDAKLDVYYKANVIGGPHAFVMTAQNYQDYAAAILRKLLREIDLRLASIVPEIQPESQISKLPDPYRRWSPTNRSMDVLAQSRPTFCASRLNESVALFRFHAILNEFIPIQEMMNLTELLRPHCEAMRNRNIGQACGNRCTHEVR
jgi:Protein of unknown function (DUF1194)